MKKQNQNSQHYKSRLFKHKGRVSNKSLNHHHSSIQGEKTKFSIYY